MKFLFLLHDDADAVAALAPEDRRAIVDEHIAYSAAHRARGAFLAGEALMGLRRPRSSGPVVRHRS